MLILMLPLYYKDQFDTDVYWICDYDEQKRITSVFIGHGDKYIRYLETEQQVNEQEQLLKDKGWVKCINPQIEITFDQPKTTKNRLHDRIKQMEQSRRSASHSK